MSFVYLVLSTGFTINAHYCGGNLQSVSFFQVAKDCNKCGTKKMKGCCKDISQSFQIDDDHNSSTQKICLKAPFVQKYIHLISRFTVKSEIDLTEESTNALLLTDQSFSCNTPIYIQTRSIVV